MEEIAENQLFEHNLGVSVRAQPVRPVKPTGQTGLHGSARGLLLALLKYPFYPLFIFDNGMNLISKSLTVLTQA